jgi:SH3-like domain-containing protein
MILKYLVDLHFKDAGGGGSVTVIFCLLKCGMQYEIAQNASKWLSVACVRGMRAWARRDVRGEAAVAGETSSASISRHQNVVADG